MIEHALPTCINLYGASKNHGRHTWHAPLEKHSKIIFIINTKIKQPCEMHAVSLTERLCSAQFCSLPPDIKRLLWILLCKTVSRSYYFIYFNIFCKLRLHELLPVHVSVWLWIHFTSLRLRFVNELGANKNMKGIKSCFFFKATLLITIKK